MHKSIKKVDIITITILLSLSSIIIYFTFFYRDQYLVNSYDKILSPIDYIYDSFIATFISNDRYIFILNGVFATIRITVFSTFWGTALALLIYIYSISGGWVVSKLYNIYIIVLQGIPVLVLIMIFYYILFKNSLLNGEQISILALSTNFSAYVSQIIRDGVSKINSGQYEASNSLGFNKSQTIIKFILPQSIVYTLPSYKLQVVELLKNSSVVGYIAVLDMTKMSELISSRTYDPFIPIIFAAIVYYILSLIIIKLIDNIILKLDWNNVINKTNNTK